MEDIKQEIYEQDAIDEKIAIAEEKRKHAEGMEKCSQCGCWCYEEDLYNGICESCINDIVAGATLEDVIEYASRLSEEDELTLYTQYLFNEQQAIVILKQQARHVKDYVSFKNAIKNYIECDVGHYIDYLESKGEI